jgi:hypothetical protein
MPGRGVGEKINGLYKTEVIRRMGPWRSLKAAEFLPAEAEAR